MLKTPRRATGLALVVVDLAEHLCFPRRPGLLLCTAAHISLGCHHPACPLPDPPAPARCTACARLRPIALAASAPLQQFQPAPMRRRPSPSCGPWSTLSATACPLPNLPAPTAAPPALCPHSASASNPSCHCLHMLGCSCGCSHLPPPPPPPAASAPAPATAPACRPCARPTTPAPRHPCLATTPAHHPACLPSHTATPAPLCPPRSGPPHRACLFAYWLHTCHTCP
ncbi:hypothetical protein DFH08DRAFT_956757 [Mycena albidolilacea]|uniref:Uncharacterized protein n=1 Tax=Mycena albidolilacea TaxID=1033008 RepID=A0AAD7A893_9AGAR|nr:hypothetical protein DFH08DRAFT_956757 [Mycena albidolilacea]